MTNIEKYGWAVLWDFSPRIQNPQLNPLHLKSDKHLISPNRISPESNIKVTRIKEMITNSISSWLQDKFSL